MVEVHRQNLTITSLHPPQHRTSALGELASDEEAFVAARTLQAQHDIAAMKHVKRMGFVGIREPTDLTPHRPLYAQCLYRADESGLTKDVPKGEAGGANGCKQRAS